MTSKGSAIEAGNRIIITFGDSTTALRPGIDMTYSDLLRKELPKYGISGNIINKGIPGNTTNDAMARFHTDVLDQNPDLVIIQFGINDSAYDVWKEPPATEPRVSLSTYVVNITSMVHQIKIAGAEVILMTPNPLRWSETTLGLYGKNPYDINNPWGFNVILSDYAQAIRDIAAAENIPLIDVQSAFIAYDDATNQSVDDLLLDGMHPNNTGHRIVANMLEAERIRVHW